MGRRGDWWGWRVRFCCLFIHLWPRLSPKGPALRASSVRPGRSICRWWPYLFVWLGAIVYAPLLIPPRAYPPRVWPRWGPQGLAFAGTCMQEAGLHSLHSTSFREPILLLYLILKDLWIFWDFYQYFVRQHQTEKSIQLLQFFLFVCLLVKDLAGRIPYRIRRPFWEF